MSNIAVLDTETNFNDEVMSIGVVAADASTFKSIAGTYLILTPECRIPAIFSDVLKHRRAGFLNIL